MWHPNGLLDSTIYYSMKKKILVNVLWNKSKKIHHLICKIKILFLFLRFFDR